MTFTRLSPTTSTKRAAASAHLRYEDIGVATPSLSARGSGVVDASFGSWKWGDGVVEGIAVQGTFRDSRIGADDTHVEMRSGTLGLRVPLNV